MRRLVAALCLALVLSGCGGSFPRDPDGTLSRVSGGTLRVGVNERAPYTQVDSDGTVTGTEADLVQGYAESVGAQVQWVPGVTSELVRELGRGEVDLVIGGIRDDQTVGDRVVLTVAHGQEMSSDGARHPLVFAAPAGENAFLVSVERYLIQHGSYS